MKIKKVDIIFGLCWGDEGKGKVSNILCDEYDFVCRWNGGSNAGHTVFINKKKYKTHIVPCGIFKNKKSIIGPNCVLNIEKFLEEIDYLKSNGFNTDLIKVSPRAHIVTKKHIDYDNKYLKKKLGTTGQGIAPAYADKMLRVGELAKTYLDKKFIWDEKIYGKILCEGAQSFWLDINYGNYPYVTSSETLPYSACSLGFSPKYIKDIIGIAKIYDTKSGEDPLFPASLEKDHDLRRLIEIGEEFGTTTGRKRKVNWLNMDYLLRSVSISGCTKIIINKCDIINQIKIYKFIYKNKINIFSSFEEMKKNIQKIFYKHNIKINIIFSGDKCNI